MRRLSRDGVGVVDRRWSVKTDGRVPTRKGLPTWVREGFRRERSGRQVCTELVRDRDGRGGSGSRTRLEVRVERQVRRNHQKKNGRSRFGQVYQTRDMRGESRSGRPCGREGTRRVDPYPSERLPGTRTVRVGSGRRPRRAHGKVSTRNEWTYHLKIKCRT